MPELSTTLLGGYDPNLNTLQNPYTKIREKYGIAKTELAKDIGLESEQVVRRTELGLYARPNPRVTSYLANLIVQAGEASTSALAEHHLLQEYAVWQSYNRKLYQPYMHDRLVSFIRTANGSRYKYSLNSVIGAVAGSKMEFCKILCVNPAQIAVVLGKRRIPDFLRSALDDMGIRPDITSRVDVVLLTGLGDPFFELGDTFGEEA